MTQSSPHDSTSRPPHTPPPPSAPKIQPVLVSATSRIPTPLPKLVVSHETTLSTNQRGPERGPGLGPGPELGPGLGPGPELGPGLGPGPGPRCAKVSCRCASAASAICWAARGGARPAEKARMFTLHSWSEGARVRAGGGGGHGWSPCTVGVKEQGGRGGKGGGRRHGWMLTLHS